MVDLSKTLKARIRSQLSTNFMVNEARTCLSGSGSTNSRKGPRDASASSRTRVERYEGSPTHRGASSQPYCINRWRTWQLQSVRFMSPYEHRRTRADRPTVSPKLRSHSAVGPIIGCLGLRQRDNKYRDLGICAEMCDIKC